MKSLKSWFEKTFPNDPLPRAERRTVPGLEALHWTGKAPGLDDIKDISSTGMYVLTRERWPQGEVNPIRLVCEDLPEDAPTNQVTVETKSVRWGNDGMGLEFVLPPCMELWLWKTDGLVEADDILTEFRTARALAFLRRICPSATQELSLLFREGLSNIRIESAVQIALLAEAMLAREGGTEKFACPQSLVMRIVQNGSWADIDLTQRMWAGMLVTSCTRSGIDESNHAFVDVLSELAGIHGKLFASACTRATKVLSEPGTVSALPIIYTAEELAQIAGAHDLQKIDRNLLQMALLGLFEERVKAKFFSYDMDARITPTSLGLELYARCQGYRGNAYDYYRSLPSNSSAVPS